MPSEKINRGVNPVKKIPPKILGEMEKKGYRGKSKYTTSTSLRPPRRNVVTQPLTSENVTRETNAETQAEVPVEENSSTTTGRYGSDMVPASESDASSYSERTIRKNKNKRSDEVHAIMRRMFTVSCFSNQVNYVSEYD